MPPGAYLRACTCRDDTIFTFFPLPLVLPPSLPPFHPAIFNNFNRLVKKKVTGPNWETCTLA